MSRLTIAVLVTCLLASAAAHAARPKTRQTTHVSDLLHDALDLEREGSIEEAEDALIDLYNSLKGKKYRNEREWLSYINVLRNLIAFYCRRGEFREADWYYRDYTLELEDDQEEEERHALVVSDVTDIAEKLIAGNRLQQAEEALLFVTDHIEELFGFDHWLTRNLYKTTLKLYIRMGNQEKIDEYGSKVRPEGP